MKKSSFQQSLILMIEFRHLSAVFFEMLIYKYVNELYSQLLKTDLINSEINYSCWSKAVRPNKTGLH